MKRLIYIVMVLALSSALQAQTAAQADAAFSAKDYAKAAVAYRHLLDKAPQNQLYLYRYARCLQETDSVERAIEYFRLAGDRYQLRNYHLATLYAKTYRFDLAAETYQSYLSSLTDDTTRRQEVLQQLAYCRKAQRYIRRVDDIVFVDSITLPFEQLLSHLSLSDECGSIEQSGATTAYTTQRHDRRLFADTVSGKQQLVGCFDYDGVADCDTLAAPVNGNHNDAFPFMLTDGVTLYLASDREEGLGGYDIYITRLNSTTQQWYEPENIGFPYNSAANDFLYAEDEARGIGYFATDRHAPQGYATLYSFLLNESKTVVGDDERARRLAQLADLRFATPADLEARDAVANEVEQEQTEADEQQLQQVPVIVLNDSIAYFSADEFVSNTARAMFLQLVQLDSSISEERQQLDLARQRYAQMPDNGPLRAVITTAEYTLVNMYRERHTLLLDIRREETTALSQRQ